MLSCSPYATFSPSRDTLTSLASRDPVYTDTDKQVLQSLNITVVDDPRAFLHVDEASVIFSVSPDIPVREIIADIARPAILLWNKVAEGNEENALE